MLARRVAGPAEWICSVVVYAAGGQAKRHASDGGEDAPVAGITLVTAAISHMV